MKKTVIGGVMAAAMLATGVAQADSGLGVGVKIGMLGLGAEVTKSLNDTFNARLGINSYKFTTSATESGTNYDIDLKWQSSALLLDWHPNGGTFRLTAGYLFNANKLAMTVKPGSTFDIGGQTGTLGANEFVNADVSFDNGPFVGLGWGNAAKGKGFGMSFELGAAYQGTPKVKLNTNLNVTRPGTIDQAEIDREQANLQSSLSNYQWYPQVALGVSYTF